MRYDKRQIFKNERDEIKDLLKSRNRTFILQYNTPILRFPTIEEMAKLNIHNEVWKVGDRLYKYATKYYNDPNVWWVIGWYNQRPTDGHYKIGDIVEIPMPLEEVLRMFKV